LGRTLPVAEETGPPRRDRFVGIFYFLWHNRDLPARPAGDGPYDIRKILAADPDALSKPDSLLWGPRGSAHYWGEPLYGYYRSEDPWVLRRHAHALADAGVDVLIFDTTNAVTYPRVYTRLCELFRTIREEGGHTPQIAFMVNTQAGKTAERIYHDLYLPGRFPELWFRWENKPLLICDPEKANSELREFFTLRRAHWPFTMVNTDRAWHWEAAYPQPFGFVDDPQNIEQVNVSVAQNLRRSDGKVTNMSDGNARGRSFHKGAVDNSPGAVDHGYNFQEQWGRALQLDPPLVMITGWNEWIAGRFERPGHPVAFVDQYDQEHSRDIEFARHGHLDNYYYQMVANIRRYKGAPRLPAASGTGSIDLSEEFSQWRDVAPRFTDHVGETQTRDHVGVGGTHYRNNSGRNDLVECKVAHDEQSIYFYLRAGADFLPTASPAGLWLLIDVDQRRATGWEGYDLIIGRECVRAPDAEGVCRLSLERNVGGWQWEKAVSVEARQRGAQLQLAIPRTFFRDSAGTRLQFDFKWADNLQEPGNVQDFYVSGDVAPEGRFNYRFRTR
jgi:hypothetical protein